LSPTLDGLVQISVSLYLPHSRITLLAVVERGVKSACHVENQGAKGETDFHADRLSSTIINVHYTTSLRAGKEEWPVVYYNNEKSLSLG